MRTFRLLRRRRALLNCAPISHNHLADRSMRAAISREDGSEEFVNQQNFDRAVAELVRLVPIPPESAEWFSDKDAIRARKWTWRRIVLNPAVVAVSIALVVIAGVFTFHLLGRLSDFPGSATARKLLTVAGSTRSVMLDPVSAEAGTLSDLFIMKHGLEHYDVPEEFADFRTIGCRVFDDDESQRIAQIWVAEKRMQFFLFPAERDTKTGAVLRFPGWRYVHQEGWVGAVTEHNGVCFMVVLQGREKDLEQYLTKKQSRAL
jgi:hypothetical protein